MYRADYPRVTHPSAAKLVEVQALPLTPLDLHVLGTPPAFILSQDQTLKFISFLASFNATMLYLFTGFAFRFYYINETSSLISPNQVFESGTLMPVQGPFFFVVILFSRGRCYIFPVASTSEASVSIRPYSCLVNTFLK